MTATSAVSDRLESFFNAAASRGIYPNKRNLRVYLHQIFGETDFSAKRLIDIGAGVGLFGLYAACAGASRVVCLEPEAAGSTAGLRGLFEDMVDDLRLDTVTMLPDTFHAFNPGTDEYDIILLHNSINHLDEQACTHLANDTKARDTYRALATKLFDIAANRAQIIVADCSRHNLFAHLHLRNPLAPMIEWEKHQSPTVWSHVLSEAGFTNPRIRWTYFNTLGTLGHVLLGNRFASYMLISHFCLTMEKP